MIRATAVTVPAFIYGTVTARSTGSGVVGIVGGVALGVALVWVLGLADQGRAHLRMRREQADLVDAGVLCRCDRFPKLHHSGNCLRPGDPPRNPRIRRPDGQLIPCELVYDGTDAFGMHVWRASLGHGDRLIVAAAAPGTCIRYDIEDNDA